MRKGASVSEEGTRGLPAASDPRLRATATTDLDGAGGKLDANGGLDSSQSLFG
jgi:hypothetical protein